MEAFIFQQINGLALNNHWLDSLGIFFSEIVPYILVIFLFLLLLKNFNKYSKMVILSLTAGFLSRGFVELIRYVVGRPRPYVENNVNLIAGALKSTSFPSAHTAFFFAFAIIIYLYDKRLGLVFFIITPIIAISRVYCGLHWPLDIVIGALVGCTSAFVVLKIVDFLKK